MDKRTKRIESMRNYILILDWMQDELKLHGNELLCYAIIYGFSQDNESMMTGGLDYLCERIHASRTNVIKILQSLTGRNLIERTEVITNNSKRVYYRVNKVNQEGVNKVNQGGKQSLLRGVNTVNPVINNIEINNKNKDKKISPYGDTKNLPENERIFYEGMLENYPNVCKLDDPLTYKQYKKLQEKYDTSIITDVLMAMENKKDLTKKYRSAYLTLNKWIQLEKERSSK